MSDGIVRGKGGSGDADGPDTAPEYRAHRNREWDFPVAGDVPLFEKLSLELRALAKDLKRRGLRFVGPTTVYAFTQTMGRVNDHMTGCAARVDAAGAQRAFRVSS
jgi:3-methyladenine DNA glycosylase Tag